MAKFLPGKPRAHLTTLRELPDPSVLRAIRKAVVGGSATNLAVSIADLRRKLGDKKRGKVLVAAEQLCQRSVHHWVTPQIVEGLLDDLHVTARAVDEGGLPDVYPE